MSDVSRGEIWWAELAEPRGSEPGFRPPVLVVQSDAFNRSAIGTVVVAALTSELGRGRAPGNVVVTAKQSGLPRDSVVNVSQLLTLDKDDLSERAGALSPALMKKVDEGIALVLDL